jgi:hypothetical protein
MDVHRAARIAGAGHGGQILLSQSSRELIQHDLPSGMTLRSLGDHKLKDIRFPQTVYQLDIDGLPTDFPPLKTRSGDDEPPTPGDEPYKDCNTLTSPIPGISLGVRRSPSGWSSGFAPGVSWQSWAPRQRQELVGAGGSGQRPQTRRPAGT